jgi:propionyl-CoA synthetase
VPLSAHHVSTAAQVIQQYNVNALLTAPTALRAIVREDPKAEFMTKYDLTKYDKCASNQVAACTCILIFLGRSKWQIGWFLLCRLRAIFPAGEHFDPATARFLARHLHHPCLDHYWQTESGWPIVANPTGMKVSCFFPALYRVASQHGKGSSVLTSHMILQGGAKKNKYGSACMPMPGWDLRILNESGKEVGMCSQQEYCMHQSHRWRIQMGSFVSGNDRFVNVIDLCSGPNERGEVALKLPLPPGALLDLYNATDVYKDKYLATFPGYYRAGDAGYRDEEGYVHIMNRVDGMGNCFRAHAAASELSLSCQFDQSLLSKNIADVINVAGHRLSTGQMVRVRCTLASHLKTRHLVHNSAPSWIESGYP